MQNIAQAAIFVLAATLAATAPLAAPPSTNVKVDFQVAVSDDARCRKEVAQYKDALQFVRQSAGEQVGAKVMNNYVAMDQLDAMVFRGGYCAGAQMLRSKGAAR